MFLSVHIFFRPNGVYPEPRLIAQESLDTDLDEWLTVKSSGGKSQQQLPEPTETAEEHQLSVLKNVLAWHGGGNQVCLESIWHRA